MYSGQFIYVFQWVGLGFNCQHCAKFPHEEIQLYSITLRPQVAHTPAHTFSDKIHFLKSNSIKKGKRQKLFFLPRLTTDLGRSFWPWGRTRPGVAPTACPAWRWRRGWRAACWPTGPAPRSAGHGASSTGWSSRSPRTAFCRDPIAGQDGGELRSRGMSSEFLFVWGASVEDRTVLF